MSRITVIVSAFEDTKGLRYTLESLCEQTDESFDVLIVQCGENEENLALIKEYCDEYVGFAYIQAPPCLIPESRNLGAARTENDLLLFMLEGDYLSPESIESFMKAYEETKADILCPRLYVSGENEPYYLPRADILATVPKIDRFDAAFLHTLNIPGRVIKKKFFDLYSLKFPAVPAYYEADFISRCVFHCDATLTGVAGAIYDDKNGVFSKGFLRNGAPDGGNLRTVCELYDRLSETVKDLIIDDTGSFDGDEYTFQEILFSYFTALTDGFYRYFWFLTDEDLKTLREKYEALTALMTEERRKNISTVFADLRFPSMYMTRKDAADLPMVSLLIDFTDYENLPALVTSLYTGRLPFFELFVRKSGASYVPERWENTENLHILPDENFFAEARRQAVGVPINVKDASPLDPKILSELSLTRAPKSMYQYIFATKRKKTGAKTFLKKKGLSMN